MPTITTFAEAQNVLRPFYDTSRTNYSLDVMFEFMTYLGNPQNKLKVVHVAGTSGKTSTSYYVAALLHEAGASVGLFVSPHVDNVNERLQINGSPVPETEFCAVLEEFLTLVAESGIELSYFELFTAMAYWEFARRGLDYVVMEVGLGGLLDATNVVDRPDKVCIITDIGLDHTEILGDTLAKIAAQKAGIIHDGNEVFMYEQSEEVMQVVIAKAQEHHAQLHRLPLTDAITFTELPLFQRHNLGLAAQTVDYVNARDGRATLRAQNLRTVAQIVVPARLERFMINGKTVIVDGSHNQQKLHALLESVNELYPNQQIAAVAGFVKGGDARWQGGLVELMQAAQHIIFTGFYSELDLPKSSIDPNALAAYARSQNFNNLSVIAGPQAALQALLGRPEPILLVTGSFYLLNHIRPFILDHV